MAPAMAAAHSKEKLPTGLALISDDFSIQVRDTEDAMFWLRVERSSSTSVEVSDLKCSEVPEDRVVSALVAAVDRALECDSVERLIFLDLAPVREKELAALRAQHEAAIISKLVVLFAKRSRLQIVEANLISRHGKVDLHFDFAPL
jgi:hypothetical protein